MRKSKKVLKQIITEIENIPNVSIVCARVGISRQTYYRWLRTDAQFAENVTDAMVIGNESICDMAEGKMVELVRAGDFRALKHILDNRHREYKKPRDPRWYKEKPKQKSPESNNKIMFVDFSDPSGIKAPPIGFDSPEEPHSQSAPQTHDQQE